MPTLVACVPASSGQMSPDTTRHAACSRPGSVPFRIAAHALRRELVSCLVRLRWRGGGHPCLWWTPSWPVHDLNILLVQKGCCAMCCMGRGIVLDVRKVTSKHPRRPRKHLIPQDPDVPKPVHGFIHHDQLTPPSHGGLHPIPWLTGHGFHH